MPAFDPQLKIAIRTVAECCHVARQVQRDLEQVKQITKDDRSPVTVADYAVQAVVAMRLREALGDVLIVGEEGAEHLRMDDHATVRQEVLRAGGTNSPVLRRVRWDVSPWIGKQVFLRIVDRKTRSWAHVTFDDFSVDGQLVQP